MKLEYSELEDGIRLLKLAGALDMMGTRSVQTDFMAYSSGDNLRVLVDFSEVDYLSSSGIHLVVNIAHSIESRGGKLALLSPQPNVQDVLELTGISQMIPIHADLDAARRALLAA